MLSSSASAPSRAVALSASTKPRWLRHRMPIVSRTAAGNVVAEADGERVAAALELGPRQRAALVDEGGAVRSSYRGQAEAGRRVGALAPDHPGHPEVLVGAQRRDHAAAQQRGRRSTTAGRSGARELIWSPQDREASSRGELVEGLLHPLAHLAVDLVDVGVGAELSLDVDRLEHPGRRSWWAAGG